MLGLTTLLEYFRESSELICTSRGGLVNNVRWFKDGVMISIDDPQFTQSMVLLDRTTATSQLVLSSGNISNFIGTFSCEIMDGNGRDSVSILEMNGMFYRNII